MDDIYKNIEDYNPNKKRKILIVFDDMIADMLSNKKPWSNSNWIIYQRQETKHFTCFYYTALFCCAKSSTHYFIMKIPIKWKVR